MADPIPIVGRDGAGFNWRLLTLADLIKHLADKQGDKVTTGTDQATQVK